MPLIMRPDPFSTEVSRLFNSLLDSGESQAQQRWSPAMDLIESDDHFVLRADVPGVAENDVKIEIQDNVLTISGERRTEHERTERGFHRVERSFGRFSRSLTLPDGIDSDAVIASFARGVLEIRVPKPEQRKPRVVSIQPGSQQTVEGTVTSAKPSQPVEGGASGAAPDQGRRAESAGEQR